MRLTGCSLRCVWCDTKYSYYGGKEMTLEEILSDVGRFPARLVEITGGEPLEQEDVYPLMQAFLEREYSVMLETGGHVAIDRVPKPVIKIIDVKCPGSREVQKNNWANIELAQPHDEFKFVIVDRQDYEWARDIFNQRLKTKPNTTLFSPSHDDLSPVDLARWILEDGLPVRLQLQAHKYIWGAHARGV